jgi:adenosylcobinamide-GDP ribazoletransferase
MGSPRIRPNGDRGRLGRDICLGVVNQLLPRAVFALAENLRFFTRLPLGGSAQAPDFTKIAWAAPLAGAIVGGLGALVFLGTRELGLPRIICSTLSVSVEIVFTGGLHEDGLADVADGFGGGRNREAKLAIMRDSRIGSYGAIALCLVLLLRIEAIAALARPHPGIAAAAFVLSGAAARAAALAPLTWTAPARADGVGVSVGALDASVLLGVAATLIVLTVALGLMSLGLIRSSMAFVVGSVVARLFVALSKSQIGGQTGDVCGAVAEIVQVAVLITLLIGSRGT